jgi:glycine cleavage system H lipoate-binding protein
MRLGRLLDKASRICEVFFDSGRLGRATLRSRLRSCSHWICAKRRGFVVYRRRSSLVVVDRSFASVLALLLRRRDGNESPFVCPRGWRSTIMVALMIVALVLSALTADYFVLRVRRRVPSERWVREPSGVFVAPGHMWLVPEAAGLVRVGADAMVGLLLGQPERIEWSGPGAVKRGEPLAVLHARHRRLTLRSPVDGVVVERNTRLDPAALARAPLGAGWLVRLEAQDLQKSLSRAVTGDGLREWSRRELDRLRSFALAAIPPGVVGATAADGGPLGPDVVSILDEKAWTEAAELMFDVGRDLSSQGLQP